MFGHSTVGDEHHRYFNISCAIISLFLPVRYSAEDLVDRPHSSILSVSPQ